MPHFYFLPSNYFHYRSKPSPLNQLREKCTLHPQQISLSFCLPQWLGVFSCGVTRIIDSLQRMCRAERRHLHFIQDRRPNEEALSWVTGSPSNRGITQKEKRSNTGQQPATSQPHSAVVAIIITNTQYTSKICQALGKMLNAKFLKCLILSNFETSTTVIPIRKMGNPISRGDRIQRVRAIQKYGQYGPCFASNTGKRTRSAALSSAQTSPKSPFLMIDFY